MTRHRGFTLVEVLISVIIIGILAGGFMLTFGSTSDKADAVKIISDMKTMSKASLFYFADREEWPSNKEELEDYLDRNLVETDKVSYDVAFISDKLYIQATLPDYSQEGIKEKLASMAQKTGLFQRKDDSVETYESTSTVAYVPVSHAPFMPTATSDSLFSASFESESELDTFTKLKGNSDWDIEHNSLVATGAGEHRYSFGDTDWEDYEINLTAAYDNDPNKGGYGVYYRADGESDITGYVFQYDPGLGNKFVVRKVENGKETSPIASIKIKEVMGDDFDIMGTPHNISISVNGSSHSIKVDNVEVLSFTDSSYSNGSAGLRTWRSGGTATFDNVSVIEL